MNTCASLPSTRLAPRIVCALLVAVLGTVCSTARACWQQAAERYNINPHVLMAIAKCESSMNPAAMNRSHYERTGTYDIGLMQINSSNLRSLSAMGIGERELLDACTNINVGAWILAQKVQRFGNSWEAVGAYNAACSQLKGEACSAARNKYARCVYKNLPPELKGSGEAGQKAAAAQASAASAVEAQPEPAPAPAPMSARAAARRTTRLADFPPQIVAVKVSQ